MHSNDDQLVDHVVVNKKINQSPTQLSNCSLKAPKKAQLRLRYAVRKPSEHSGY